MMRSNLIEDQDPQQLLFPKQKLSPIWNVLLISPLLLVIYLFPVRQLMDGSFSADSLIPVAITVSSMALLYFMALRVKISKDVVWYKMSPLHFRFKEITQDRHKNDRTGCF